MKPYLLAIDNGTQSVRALVFDLQGQLVAKSKVELEAYFSEQPGWAEQDPQYFWANLCEACRQLWETIDFPRDQIRAVALTTQRATVVNLDAQGKPLRPAIVWLDQRRSEDLPPMGGIWDPLIRLSGRGATLDYFRSEAECNWLGAAATGNLESHPQVPAALGLSQLPADRSLRGRRGRAGRLPAVRREAFSLGRARGLEVAGAPDPARNSCPSCGRRASCSDTSATAPRARPASPPDLPLIAAGADKACEVHRFGLHEPGHRQPELRHHGDVQHHQPPLSSR